VVRSGSVGAKVSQLAHLFQVRSSSSSSADVVLNVSPLPNSPPPPPLSPPQKLQQQQQQTSQTARHGRNEETHDVRSIIVFFISLNKNKNRIKNRLEENLKSLNQFIRLTGIN